MAASAPLSIALATGNPHKAEELSALLGGQVAITTAPAGFNPEENGETLLQNALIKANALRTHVGPDVLVVADDTGLCVNHLGGRPGVYSARYAGPDATFDDNNRLLLHELEGAEDRSAAFVCVLVGMSSDGGLLTAAGVLPGTICEAPRGELGFGYDPVFVPQTDTRTMAQMSPDDKNRISHRGRAARALARLLGLTGSDA